MKIIQEQQTDDTRLCNNISWNNVVYVAPIRSNILFIYLFHFAHLALTHDSSNFNIQTRIL